MAGRRNKNFGGSGARDSTTTFFVRHSQKKRIPVFKSKEINHYVGKRMSEEELEKYLAGNELQCLECGNHYKHLTLHLFYSHLLNREDYCVRYGIPLVTTLVGQGIRKRLSDDRKDRFANLEKEDKDEIRKRLRVMNYGKKFKRLRIVLCSQCFKQYQAVSGKSEALCSNCLDKNREANLAKYDKSLGLLNHPRECPECSKVFTMTRTQFYNLSKKDRVIFCSRICGLKYYGKKRSKKAVEQRKCQNCNESYVCKKSRKSLFCSQKCYLQCNRDTEGKFKLLTTPHLYAT